MFACEHGVKGPGKLILESGQIGCREGGYELIPAKAESGRRNAGIDRRSVWIVSDDSNRLEEVWSVRLRYAAARPTEAVHRFGNQMNSGPPSLGRLLKGRDDQYSADDCKGELQVNVNRKRSYVPESIPYGASHSKIDGFDLDREPKSVKRVTLGNICIGSSQGTGHFSLTCVASLL